MLYLLNMVFFHKNICFLQQSLHKVSGQLWPEGHDIYNRNLQTNATCQTSKLRALLFHTIRLKCVIRMDRRLNTVSDHGANKY
jgi:hypothetical protein